MYSVISTTTAKFPRWQVCVPIVKSLVMTSYSWDAEYSSFPPLFKTSFWRQNHTGWTKEFKQLFLLSANILGNRIFRTQIVTLNCFVYLSNLDQLQTQLICFHFSLYPIKTAQYRHPLIYLREFIMAKWLDLQKCPTQYFHINQNLCILGNKQN